MATGPQVHRGLTLSAFIVYVASGLVLGVPPDWSRAILETEPRPAGAAEPAPIALSTFATTPQPLGDIPGGAIAAVGGDNCNQAAVTPIPVGPAGSPITTTVFGDTSAATGPDCNGLGTVWWEAFQIAQCARVKIDFCTTSPILQPSFITVMGVCGGDGSCGGDIRATTFSRGLCPGEGASGNMTMEFFSLPAGTYYYPIIRPQNPGPYVMHIAAQQASCFGACCDTLTPVCTEDVLDTDCDGPGKVWTFRRRCCEVDCTGQGVSWNMNLLSHLTVGDFPGSGSTEANDIWGYTSPKGRKYALIGLNNGTGFVDVTEPRTPVIVDDIPDSFSLWSDNKVYKDFAYNGNEESGGIQVFDLRQIDPPTRIVTLVGNFQESGLETTHTIALNPDSGYLYLNGSNLNGGRLVAVSLADPANPQIAGAWTDPDSRYVHDSQVISYTSGPYAGREIAFCFCGRNNNGMRIVDVTNKSNMFTMATMTYPTEAYTHQGWITDDRRYIIMNDELEEREGLVARTTTYVVDVQNLSAPFLAGTYVHPTGCWIDHDEHVRGNRVYQAQYTAGVRVLDISNPLAASEIAYYDTRPQDNLQDFFGVWGVFPYFPTRIVVASDIESGLFVLCDDPQRPVAGFIVDRNPAEAGQGIHFDAASSTHCDPSPARSLTSYEWDFNYNGSTFDVNATGVNAAHAYPTIGQRTVGLRVTDDLGQRDVSSFAIAVRSIDDCDNAPVISDGSRTFDTTGLATDGPSHAACNFAGDGQIHADTWFRYGANCDGFLLLDTCISSFDTRVAVYEGCDCPVSDAELLGCNDDACGTSSQLEVPVSQGSCYLIRVGGTGGANGAGTLQAFCATDKRAEPPEIVQWDANPAAAVSLVDLKMNRYVGILAPAAATGRSRAIQVEFVSLPAPFDIWNGRKLWVTDPVPVCETGGSDGGTPATCPSNTYFQKATLACTSFYRDWTTVPGGVVYVTHPGIVPGETTRYDVRMIDEICDEGAPACYSIPTTVVQATFGDIVGPFDITGGYYTAAEGNNASVSTDVTAALSKFANRAGAPSKPRADIEPCELDSKVNISDVTEVLDGFRNLPYRFAPGAGNCSSLNPCDYATAGGH